MRLPRVRFGVAGLMLVVGLAGAGMGLWQMGRRADSFRARADLYLRLEASSSRLIGVCAHALDQYRDLIVEARRTEHVDLIRSIRAEAAIAEEDLKLARGHLAYRARLRRKYDRAARYPWLSVAPDPPAPPPLPDRPLPPPPPTGGGLSPPAADPPEPG